jgi:transposase
MVTVQLPTAADVRAAYQRGKATVVALVSTLVTTIERLAARVHELDDQRSKDSIIAANHRPISGLKKRRTRSGRRKNGRKRGGQPGRQGYTLRAVEYPDHLRVHPVTECSHCHAPLAVMARSLV